MKYPLCRFCHAYNASLKCNKSEILNEASKVPFLKDTICSFSAAFINIFASKERQSSIYTSKKLELLDQIADLTRLGVNFLDIKSVCAAGVA